jgi:hypothetical protein
VGWGIDFSFIPIITSVTGLCWAAFCERCLVLIKFISFRLYNKICELTFQHILAFWQGKK